jgi:hypothetical protein
MARRVVTEQMRELARERAHGYLAARSMSAAELTELASYHARRARWAGFAAPYRDEERAAARMFANLVGRRTGTGYRYTPGRGFRPVPVRYRTGR